MSQVSKSLLAFVLTVSALSSTSAHAGKITDMVARAYAQCASFLSRTPPAPRTMLNKLVQVANLPSGYARLGYRPGLAKVVAEKDETLLVEYIDSRTKLPERVEVPKESIAIPWDFREAVYGIYAKIDMKKAFKPDLSLADKVIALPMFKPGLVHVLAATRGQLMIEVVDPEALQVRRLTITRPEGDLSEVLPQSRQDYLDLIRITQMLAANPTLREGNVLMWKPNVGTTNAQYSEEEFLRPQIYRQLITFNYEQPFTLPDVPEIRIPIIYRNGAIALRIERILLDQGAMRVTGAGWSGTMRLSPALLSKSNFYFDEMASFRFLPEQGFESFAEFRKRFFYQSLVPGDSVVLWPADEKFVVGAPVENGTPTAYQIIYADRTSVIIKRPGETLELTDVKDLGRLTMSAGSQSAEALFAAQNPNAPKMIASGEFKPTNELTDSSQYKFLRQMTSIRADLLSIGMEPAAIEHYAKIMAANKNITAYNYFYRPPEVVKSEPVDIKVTLKNKWSKIKSYFGGDEPIVYPVSKPKLKTFAEQKAETTEAWKAMRKFAHPDKTGQLGVSPAAVQFLQEMYARGSMVMSAAKTKAAQDAASQPPPKKAAPVKPTPTPTPTAEPEPPKATKYFPTN